MNLFLIEYVVHCFYKHILALLEKKKIKIIFRAFELKKNAVFRVVFSFFIFIHEGEKGDINDE